MHLTKKYRVDGSPADLIAQAQTGDVLFFGEFPDAEELSWTIGYDGRLFLSREENKRNKIVIVCGTEVTSLGLHDDYDYYGLGLDGNTYLQRDDQLFRIEADGTETSMWSGISEDGRWEIAPDGSVITMGDEDEIIRIFRNETKIIARLPDCFAWQATEKGIFFEKQEGAGLFFVKYADGPDNAAEPRQVGALRDDNHEWSATWGGSVFAFDEYTKTVYSSLPEVQFEHRYSGNETTVTDLGLATMIYKDSGEDKGSGHIDMVVIK